MSLLETERLLIDEANENDSSFFFRLMNAENWLKFIGDRKIRTEGDAELYIQNSLIKSYRLNGFGLYKIVLKQNMDAVGICGFVQRDYLDNPDIGFAILPEYEGMGLAYEASFSLMSYGVDKLDLKEIFGITTEDNIGSQKVLNKIGLHRRGIITPNSDQEEFILFSNVEED